MAAAHATVCPLVRTEPFRTALAGVPLPVAAVDLAGFEHNVDAFVTLVRNRGKRLRIATKSLRVPLLIDRVVQRAAPYVAGLLTYTAAETDYLATPGADLLLAYPTASPTGAAHLAAANARGATASVVVDDSRQLATLAEAARSAGCEIPVVVELDVAYRRVGVHVGVRRSPIREAEEVVALAEQAAAMPGLRFHGLLGYEAQIAGLPDAVPGQPVANCAKRLLKRVSTPDVARRRAQVVALLNARGLSPTIVNGAGTGNAAKAADDPSLTELAVGSGFLPGHLFDRYAGLDLEPALQFALEVVRSPAPGLVTCLGGGYIASGAAGPDRLPKVVHPIGAQLLPHEGAGEVQTPIRLPPGTTLPLGAPVFLRHAKSGELAEHFTEYLLVRDGRIESRAPTYRGLGHCFLG